MRKVCGPSTENSERLSSVSRPDREKLWMPNDTLTSPVTLTKGPGPNTLRKASVPVPRVRPSSTAATGTAWSLGAKERKSVCCVKSSSCTPWARAAAATDAWLDSGSEGGGLGDCRYSSSVSTDKACISGKTLGGPTRGISGHATPPPGGRSVAKSWLSCVRTVESSSAGSRSSMVDSYIVNRESERSLIICERPRLRKPLSTGLTTSAREARSCVSCVSWKSDRMQPLGLACNAPIWSAVTRSWLIATSADTRASKLLKPTDTSKVSSRRTSPPSPTTNLCALPPVGRPMLSRIHTWPSSREAAIRVWKVCGESTRTSSKAVNVLRPPTRTSVMVKLTSSTSEMRKTIGVNAPNVSAKLPVPPVDRST